MSPITPSKSLRASLALLIAVTALPTLTALTGCANKAVMKPKANFLQNGTYRSRIEAVPGAMTGLSLQLNGNGRFSFATLESGCFLAEDWGVWTSTQEELTLRVEKSMRRATCASAWQTVAKDTAYHCSMRNVTDRSFQMLHDEIQQGTLWTAWEREVAQGYAELERLRMQPEAEAVTWRDASFSESEPQSASEKSSRAKARSSATRKR
jgi:hypothetical protein